MKSNKMDYKKMAVGVFEAMNTSEFSKFQENACEDISFEFPGVDRIEGSKRVILFFKVLLRKYKDLKFEVTDVILEDDKACVVWNNKGEYNDGTPYKNSGITLFHFREKKVSFISDYFKDTSFTNSN